MIWHLENGISHLRAFFFAKCEIFIKQQTKQGTHLAKPL